MESRNLDKALDIVSKLIAGEEISENGAESSLFMEYSSNAEVYDIVNLTLKKMNINIYEYNNALFVSAGSNNTVFGYSNEELRKELGVKLNRELYLAYFVIYNAITEFYNDTASSTYAEYIRIEDVIKDVDTSVNGIADRKEGLILDDIKENSFRQIALSWEELPTVSVEMQQTSARAARNSKAGFVKMVFNFLVRQNLFMMSNDRYYPTDRFRALIENYFDDYRGMFAKLLMDREGDEKDATD